MLCNNQYDNNYTENDHDKYELGSISATILNAKYARVLSST